MQHKMLVTNTCSCCIYRVKGISQASCNNMIYLPPAFPKRSLWNTTSLKASCGIPPESQPCSPLATIKIHLPKLMYLPAIRKLSSNLAVNSCAEIALYFYSSYRYQHIHAHSPLLCLSHMHIMCTFSYTFHNKPKLLSILKFNWQMHKYFLKQQWLLFSSQNGSI